MKTMNIPKYPSVPDFTNEQIKELTKIVFCNDLQDTNVADLIFVFGSTDPGAFQRHLKHTRRVFVKDIVISGGSSVSGAKHENWTDGSKSEAQSIRDKLVQNGIPKGIIYIEDISSNSKENVLFAKEIYDFSNVRNLYFVSKSHAAGRQYRTLRKYLHSEIKIAHYSYETKIRDGNYINHENWMNYSAGRSLVFGEYLRIIYYGRRGDIESVNGIIEGLGNYIEELFEG